jgi:glycogen debranching enzyme
MLNNSDQINLMKNFLYFLLITFSTHAFGQEILTNDSLINDAFKLAVRTVDINTRRGILAAGGDYGGEWTRDISINSWNGASLLRPSVAENSLWSVTLKRDTIGHQYWDKIIWVIAAYNHYLVTGDRKFLQQAYQCSANTMNALEQQVLDKKYGLFMGPSVFNDGIAGYPEPIYELGNNSSSVLDYKNSAYIKCLSTNCLYYGAYIALSKMSRILGDDKKKSIYTEKVNSLKNNILKHFYHENDNSFDYLIDQNGQAYKAQEGLGISFAVIFGLIDSTQAHHLISHAIVSKYGITSIYPDFPRYSEQKPGRHNNIIWPMVNGFFAKASIVAGNDTTFDHELKSLTHLALDEDKGDYNFREVYNPYSGQPDGGWQANGDKYPDYHWKSCKLQTWSATAYISMVLNGIVGLRLNEKSLTFAPYLPAGVNNIRLTSLTYRKAVLNIIIKGEGKSIKFFSIDGKQEKSNSISSAIKGEHTILIKVN